MQRLRIIRSASRSTARPFSSRTPAHNSWSSGPAPPRLPKEDQEIFERLQRQSTGAFSTPRPDESESQSTSQASTSASKMSRLEELRAKINQSPDSAPASTTKEPEIRLEGRVKASGEGEELHPHMRRGARPEFEGDRNPNTGEVGGPKNEPLRWGGGGDWSYNGRVTDF